MAVARQEKPAWKKFDPVFGMPTNMEGGENCYYARERLSKGGFGASVANQLTDNFKIDPAVESSHPYRWNKHKVGAVNQFADELAGFLPKEIAISAIPPHAKRGDEEFDPRFDMLFDALRRIRPDLRPCEPVIQSRSTIPAHLADERPSIEEILSTLQYVGFSGSAPKHLVLIDDVVTAGKHFSACRRLILANALGIHIYGVFWAKTIWPTEPPVDTSGIVAPRPDRPDDTPIGR